MNHGVQRRMVLVDNFFRFFGIKSFCLIVATCDLVRDVEDYISPSLAATSIWKSFLKYE